jgi:DNA helicase II / ATP-dependent DNA helicase PcrA
MIYSKYQLKIFETVQNEEGNKVIEAVAGSGKTTVIEKSLAYVPRGQSSFFTSFGRDIVAEISRRVGKLATAATMNAFGWKICKDNSCIEPQLDKMKTENILKYDFFDMDSEKERKIFYKVKYSITRLVSLAKALGIFDPDILVRNYGDIAGKFGIEVEEPDNLSESYGELLGKVYDRAININAFMDYDDQIFQPVYRDYPIPHFDNAFVDEDQDLNLIQMMVLERVIRDTGRLFGVGDSYQAIYGFRGADTESVANLIKRFHAETLPLSICYRCAKNVVREAQKIVPHIEYHEDAIEGVVDRIKERDFPKLIKDQDFALCRTTAPLISGCLSMIRAGRRANVKGRDIGESLEVLLSRFGEDNDLVENVAGKMSKYLSEQSQKLEKMGKEAELLNLEDRISTLDVLMEECRTVRDVKLRIGKIFSDNTSPGVTFMTIHKTKGLETNRVFILKPNLLPHPAAKQEWMKKQEKNLAYVAPTRARQELYYVDEK